MPSNPATGNPSHDPYASLRNRDFRWLVLSYGASVIAREGQIVVVGWQVFALTKDPLSLGLIGLAEALPMIAFALFAGHVADRAERRLVALLGTVGMLISAVALLAFTMRGLASVWPVYLVIFLSGIARSFTRPAYTVLSAEILPREQYANGVAWRTSTWQAAAIVGPALGGIVYGFGGAVVAYGIVCVLMAVALAAIAGITHRSAPAPKEDMAMSESLKIGVRFLLAEPVMLAAMTLDLFSVLFGGAVALLPVFATMLKAGPQGLGLLRAAPAIGSIGTGMWLAHRPPMKRAGPWLLGAVAVFGACIIAFALSRSFWLSFAILALSGMADSVSVVIRSTLLQIRTPAHMLGRVSSVNQVFIGASNEIGAFESGVAARLLGVVPSVVFGGCMTLLVVAVTAWKAPQLRRLREL
ncbi:MAG TPA: MFS transporter [Thermoanaerobaculia bacterium]|jgi:predicted MFS family arabinose efflux permease